MPPKRTIDAPATGRELRTFATAVDARFAAVDSRFASFEQRMDERTGALGVLLERIDSKVTALAEGQTAMRDELKRDLQALEARLSARIDALEAAVRQNSADIRKNTEDIRKNTEDIQRLGREVAELRARFDRRDGTLEDHEARINELEKRCGIRG